ncbi:hypothetical protein DFH29DRAFT_877165 [Suillus ampliporus]|nr:hypothetical protein DFH29DRAFT_877165 [Suillus ampliporus]
MLHGDGGASVIDSENQQNNNGLQRPPEPSQAQSAFLQAWQRRKIAELEEKLETLESGRAERERQTNYYLAQGRGIRRVITLFDSIEDLVTKNDRRFDDNLNDEDTATFDQERLHTGYYILTKTLPWFLKKSSDMEYDDYARMVKMLRQGADGARGDDMSKLKTLVANWVNHELKPNPLVNPDDKHSRRFINDTCGKLLCPAELDWNSPVTKAGIRDHSQGHTMTDLSFPAFLYEKYTANLDNLEEGPFRRKILVQGYKAVFTSPSSAKDIEGDGDGADIIENNRCTKKAACGIKVKKHVAQIIKMERVTPRLIAYIACQVRFALSSVMSWWTVDGDFDYIQFWRSIVDFFERPPSQEVQCRVDRLLEWWTRKVFGRSHHENLSDTARSSMSVNALARQRAQLDDAAFDSN